MPVIDVPEAGVFEPLAADIAMRLFAYHIIISKDWSTERPCNLAKSVTVERAI